jgi:flagellar basal body rod protein FlgG
MMRSLWTAASGMIGQQFNIDTISNNLSNVNTTGFKQNRPDFEDLLYQTVRTAGTPGHRADPGARRRTGGSWGQGRRHPENFHPGFVAEHRKRLGYRHRG